jgi:hypothetical protein
MRRAGAAIAFFLLMGAYSSSGVTLALPRSAIDRVDVY